MTTSIQKQILIEQRITNEGKSLVVAYILLFFLGVFGAHRFYLGQTTTAIMQLVFTLLIVTSPISLVWVFIDIFLVPSIVQEENNKLRSQLMAEIA